MGEWEQEGQDSIGSDICWIFRGRGRCHSAQKKGLAVENRSSSPRTIVLDDPFSSEQGARLLCQLAADASAKQISLSDLKQVGRSLFDQVMNYDADNLLPVRGLEHRVMPVHFDLTSIALGVRGYKPIVSKVRISLLW